MWWYANENCEAILGGQNAGFALLFLFNDVMLSLNKLLLLIKNGSITSMKKV